MNWQRASLLERGTRGAPTSGPLAAGVMREPTPEQGRGMVSRRALPLGISQQSHGRYDGLLVELFLRSPDMSTRQLCRLLSMHGCHWSSTTVRRARQRLEMCMAAHSSQQRPPSGRLDDFDVDVLAAAALDSGVVAEVKP